MVVDYCLSCKELTALQSCKNIYSLQNPDGLLVESTYLSWSQSGFYQESIRSLAGVHQEYQDFIRIRGGV
jgi:hypothetical protein